MAKEKLTLEELKVQSFTTALSKEQMTEVKGGIYIVQGRKFDYRVRWTSLDTRTEHSSANYGGK